MSGEPQPDAKERLRDQVVARALENMKHGNKLITPAGPLLQMLQRAALASPTTYAEWRDAFRYIMGKYVEAQAAGRNTTAEENALGAAYTMMNAQAKVGDNPRADMESIVLGTRGGRRRRHTRRRHTRRRHTRRRRGGGPQIFRDIAKKGDEVSALVDKIDTCTSKGDGAGALPDAIKLVNLVGYEETERLLKDLPPPELKKILASIR